MTNTPRALDRNEAMLVDQAQMAAEMSDRELTDLIRLLRARRDRAQRIIRTRARASERGQASPDTGAREKKALLTEAIDRISTEMKRRTDPAEQAKVATANLEHAVRRKAEQPGWTGPDELHASPLPAETPNQKIAPSGALHAEGMRAAIARSTGAR